MRRPEGRAGGSVEGEQAELARGGVLEVDGSVRGVRCISHCRRRPAENRGSFDGKTAFGVRQNGLILVATEIQLSRPLYSYAKLRKAVEELYERRRKRSGGDSDSNCSGSNRAGSERRRGAGDGERRGKSYGDADRNRNDRRDNHRDGSYRSRGGGDRYERDNHRQRNRRGGLTRVGFHILE